VSPRVPRGRAIEKVGMPRLFDASELKLKPTGQARLMALARRPGPTPTERENKQRENDAMMVKLRGWGRQLCDLHGLRFRSIDPEREGVTEHYGICYEDGTIFIRLRHAKSGKLLKESSLVDTLCHELAHLRHLDHSIRFRRLFQKILEDARELEIYQPGATTESRPTQLSLFRGGCGTTVPTRQGS
jgi:hypothetical protein